MSEGNTGQPASYLQHGGENHLPPVPPREDRAPKALEVLPLPLIAPSGFTPKFRPGRQQGACLLFTRGTDSSLPVRQ